MTAEWPEARPLHEEVRVGIRLAGRIRRWFPSEEAADEVLAQEAAMPDPFPWEKVLERRLVTEWEEDA